MKTFIILILMSFNVYADWYTSIGIAYHDEVSARPEVNLDRELASFELGYEKQFNQNWEVQGYAAHYSGLFTTEHGIGFNPIGVKLKYNF